MAATRRVFVLVHGTWATGGRWTQEGSGLRQALREFDLEAEFGTFLWSGDNLQHVRESEARRLGDWLLEYERGREGGLRFVVIAHSHGGNIAASLGGLPDVAGKLEAVICLATPFVEYSFPNEWITDEQLIVGAVLAMSLSSIARFRQCEWDSWLSQAGLYLMPLPAVVIGVGCAYLLHEMKSHFRRRARLNTRRPSKVPTLALCHQGDEAYRVLRCLDGLTGIAHLARFLLVAVLVVVSWPTRTELENPKEACEALVQVPVSADSGVAELIESILRPAQFDWLDGVIFGVKAGLLVPLVVGLFFLPVWLFRLAWTLTVTMVLHLLRGSAHVSAVIQFLGLPRLAQSGVGESFWRTMMTRSRVARVPIGAQVLSLRHVAYPRVNGPLLHTSIYESPAVWREITDYLQALPGQIIRDDARQTEKPKELVAEADGSPRDPDAAWVGQDASEPGEDSGEFVPLFDAGRYLAVDEGLVLAALLNSCGIEAAVARSGLAGGGSMLQVRAGRRAEALAIVNAQESG